jgi:von Willebrand factor type A domain.
MKQFFPAVKEFALSYFVEETTSNNISNVGVVLSTADPILAIPMSPPSPKDKFIQAFDDMKYPGKIGRLDKALKMAGSSLFKEDSNADGILVIVTDGVQAEKREALFEEARALQLRGISVYVVGIGDYDYDVLRKLASGEERVKLVSDTEVLKSTSFVRGFAESTKGTPG